MVSKNWYRKTSWTNGDKDDFFRRLQKARPDHRSQYLLIQMSHLYETGRRENIDAALKLSRVAIEEYANPIDLESIYFLQAKCYERSGIIDQAINSYRLAFAARRAKTGIRTNAPVDFAYTVATRHLTDLYREVISVINELVNDVDIILPSEKYKLAAAMALIHNYFGEKDRAKRYAEIALEAVSQTDPRLSRHPASGLVTQPDEIVIKQLKNISKS